MRAVNLVPVEQRSGTPVGAGRSQGGAYAVVVLAFGLALMAFLYGLASHDVSSQRAQAANVTERAAQETAAAERLAPYTNFVSDGQQRTQAVETLVDSRFDWAHAFHEIGRVLPRQASITSLSGTIPVLSAAPAASSAAAAGSTSTAPAGSASTAAAGSTSTGAAASTATAAKGGEATSITPPGSLPTFTLSGCATSQPAVALTLERLRLIDGVSEVTLQNSTAGSASSGGSGSGGCQGRDASFSVTVAFDPLPSTAEVAAAAKTVSDKTSASSAAAHVTTPGAGTK